MWYINTFLGYRYSQLTGNSEASNYLNLTGIQKKRLTHIILISGMSGQISEEACERTQLHVTVGTQEVQQHWQDALLLQSHPAHHWSPLQDKESKTIQIWPKLRLLDLNAFTGKLVNMLPTLVSPAVMFCSAPEAASRVVELISQLRSTRLYNPTICGCQSHSIPFGTRATSVKVERSWFLLCQGKRNTRRQCCDGWSGPFTQNADG